MYTPLSESAQFLLFYQKYEGSFKMHVIVYNEIFTGGPPSERDWASFEKQLSKFCCEDLATLKTSLNPIDFD